MVLLGVATLTGGLAIARGLAGTRVELPVVSQTARIEAPPMCPWREPERDLRSFFPGAVDYRTEVRILSAHRVELTKRLGRAPLPEENALHLYRIFEGKAPRGTVLVRRVKGEHGAIELVTALSPDGQLLGVRVQRHREPKVVAEALEADRWRSAVSPPGGGAAIGPERALEGVPPVARASVEAAIGGIRSLLILYEVAERSGLAEPAAPHH